MTTHIYIYKCHRSSCRLYLPSRPFLTEANLAGDDGFAQLGTRYKAAHVKMIIWWLAVETQRFADQHPNVSGNDFGYVSPFFRWWLKQHFSLVFFCRRFNQAPAMPLPSTAGQGDECPGHISVFAPAFDRIDGKWWANFQS